MASIEKRVRNGKTTYRVRYRDPAGSQRSKVFARKADAQRFLNRPYPADYRSSVYATHRQVPRSIVELAA
jgi:hypothetical protein